ncbi:hypothetical protein E3E12_07280 [Formicincola oecophyllae]|uniref:Uncharacterized protein n=1 Tax=Formicincola oecophyllae TaxID=2558361 RepID=A0A4Y6U971_9PROT|nr:hypothetical protein [Formicincola oecophyllae]QDH14013.1 hypothetical protein E3E12_07280 [Formicincola oecophyllae]
MHCTCQKASLCRIAGNEVVHLGKINFDDNADLARKLFRMVNLIVEKAISDPQELAETWDYMPEQARLAVEKRDAIANNPQAKPAS